MKTTLFTIYRMNVPTASIMAVGYLKTSSRRKLEKRLKEYGGRIEREYYTIGGESRECLTVRQTNETRFLTIIN